MVNQDDLEAIVRRLSTCKYKVFSEQAGYGVHHITDEADISHAANLRELTELTELFEWREQRQTAKNAM